MVTGLGYLGLLKFLKISFGITAGAIIGMSRVPFYFLLD
jgi:hypothetical protein